MLLCNPKWVQMWQTSATFVRQRQASRIYRDIVYNILYVCIHIQKIIQLSAESSDRSVGYFLRGRRESNSYKFPDVLQDSETITNRYIYFRVTARFCNNFTTRHSWNSISNTIRYQLATLLIGGALGPWAWYARANYLGNLFECAAYHRTTISCVINAPSFSRRGGRHFKYNIYRAWIWTLP